MCHIYKYRAQIYTFLIKTHIFQSKSKKKIMYIYTVIIPV